MLLCGFAGEKLPEIITRDPTYLFNVDAVKACETTSDFHNVRRFISFSAIWNWTQQWTISLNQQMLQRDVLRDGAQFISLLEGNDARK